MAIRDRILSTLHSAQEKAPLAQRSVEALARVEKIAEQAGNVAHNLIGVIQAEQHVAVPGPSQAPGSQHLHPESEALLVVAPHQVEVTAAAPRVTQHLNTRGYRDYLLRIWSNIAYPDTAPNLIASSARASLDRRFHQDFATIDMAPQPATPLVIAIVSQALLAAPGAAGFGLATLPARGSRDDATYLELLIDATKLDHAELGRRLRSRLDRDEHETTSPVDENIHTLQRFFRDDFQSSTESPSIIPAASRGYPPFFLEYAEWLEEQATFFAENHLQVERCAEMNYEHQGVERPNTNHDNKLWFHKDVLALLGALRKGHTAFRLGQLGLAETAYGEAAQLAFTCLEQGIVNDVVSLVRERPNPGITYGKAHPMLDTLHAPVQAILKKRRLQHTDTLAGLAALEDAFQAEDLNFERSVAAVTLLCATVFPALFGDVYLAQGRYADAARQYQRALPQRWAVGIAERASPAGYHKEFQWSGLYTAGVVPYTLAAGHPGTSDPIWHARGWDISLDASLVIRENLHHPAEERFYLLRLATTLLEWADELYRRDDPPSVARARELYKAALLLHDRKTGYEATFTAAAPSPEPRENPVVLAQVSRARLALAQIEAGLNYFGFSDEIVPYLRSVPLLEEAERLAAQAKAAQTDLQGHLAKSEALFKDEMQRRFVVTRARLQAEIASDQRKNAEEAIKVAEAQVRQVEAAIVAKQAEIDAHDDLLGQMSDFFSGMKDTVKGVMDGAKSVGVSSSAATTQVSGVGGTAAGGATVLGGYALFVYAGYTAMSGMSDAYNRRRAELATLKGATLTAAKTAVAIRQREANIARAHGDIALAETSWAAEWATFDARRTLGQRFHADMIVLLRRLMHRYLDMGARSAWLAERALAYEQSRAVRVMQLDYFPELHQGIGGADRLAADLAELRAVRLNPRARAVRFTHTVSLLAEHPFDLATLRKTGRCGFRTSAADFLNAYPGTYGHRVRGVEVEVITTSRARPVRGSLFSDGHSFISRADGTLSASMRFADVAPISDPSLPARYAEPRPESLLPAEGSGIDTAWEIVLPAVANPFGLGHVADVVLHFDIDASSPSVATRAPVKADRTLLLSGRHADAQAFAGLLDEGQAAFSFDVGALVGPDGGRIRSLAILVPGVSPGQLELTLTLSTPPRSARTTLIDGVLVIAKGPDTPADLLALLAVDVHQIVSLRLRSPDARAPVLAEVADVVLAVEVM